MTLIVGEGCSGNQGHINEYKIKQSYEDGEVVCFRLVWLEYVKTFALDCDGTKTKVLVSIYSTKCM